MYTITYTHTALSDLHTFRKYEQNTILDAIDTQLPYEPMVETQNRFRREPPDIADWELRIGVFRVYYNVDEQIAIVHIERIGYKPNNTVFFRKR